MLNQLYVQFPTIGSLFERGYVPTRVNQFTGARKMQYLNIYIYITVVIRFELHKTDDKKFIDITMRV